MKKGLFFTFILFMVVLSCHREEPLEPPYGERSLKVVTDRDYTSSLLNCFEESNESIHIIMYLMKYYPSDSLSGVRQLQAELVTAHQRGVEVRVILEKSEYNTSLNASNESTLVYLSQQGVEVRWDNIEVTTHAKCVVIDRRIAFVGSSNWSNSSLDDNNEVNVKICDQESITELENYFALLWEDRRHTIGK
jgi:phosphatidylserine/phosphatidylglycerophosphate/cardiolipin synthase-like enzyme